MTILRFLILLSLVVWIGGIVFFIALAPIPFSVLSRHLAGQVIAPALARLHWIGIVSAVIFLIASPLWNAMAVGSARPLAAKHLLVIAMLTLTLVSQFGVSARMSRLRSGMGEIDSIAADDPRRVAFNTLHAWSTRLEGTVLLLGLVTIFLVARESALPRSLSR